ncbi:hypothetical protein DFP73DRAFT_531121 [Morchella snyderi]|nr:hypothetical protein DFP73DRAFT_531121 [Morchella snyderi]
MSAVAECVRGDDLPHGNINLGRARTQCFADDTVELLDSAQGTVGEPVLEGLLGLLTEQPLHQSAQPQRSTGKRRPASRLPSMFPGAAFAPQRWGLIHLTANGRAHNGNNWSCAAVPITFVASSVVAAMYSPFLHSASPTRPRRNRLFGKLVHGARQLRGKILLDRLHVPGAFHEPGTEGILRLQGLIRGLAERQHRQRQLPRFRALCGRREECDPAVVTADLERPAVLPVEHHSFGDQGGGIGQQRRPDL